MISKNTYRFILPFLFFLCFLFPLGSKAQTTFFTDQCDDASPWTFGSGSPSGSYGAYTAWRMGNAFCTIDASSLCVSTYNINGNGYWSCEYITGISLDMVARRSIDARGFQTLQLKFDWMCNGSGAANYGQVGYSTNGGSSFTWITTGGGTGNGTYYGSPSIVRNQTLNLPPVLNNTQFVIGFRWINNASGGLAPGFIVDNIRVGGQLIGGGIPEPAKITLFSDECKNDQGWKLGKSNVFDGYRYTAWKIGNDSLCTIDKGTLAVGMTHPSGNWQCGYLDFMPVDLIASKKVDASHYENMELQFDWMCKGEYYLASWYDYGQVGYSLDGGASFTWLQVGGGDALGRYYGTTAIQRGQKITLPAALNGKEFLLGFRWISDYSIGGYPGFVVDNISIAGSAKATQLVAVFKDNFDSPQAWELNKAATDPAGNTLSWNIDNRCSIDGNSLSINRYNAATKDWECNFSSNAAASIIASRNIHTGNAGNLFLKMDWKVSSTAAADYGQLGYSLDGGTTYTWLNYGGNGNSGKYYNQAGIVKGALLKLPPVLEGKDFKLGLRWINDAGSNSGQAMVIDNLSIIGVPGTATPPAVEQQKICRITNELVKVAGKKTQADVNALTEEGKLVQKQYYDGTIRKIQEVLWKASPSRNDIIAPTLYDENGNAGIEFLSYKGTTTDGGYHADMLKEQDAYYNAAKPNFIKTEYPFRQLLTEKSPAGRIRERGSFGKDFQPNTPGTTRTATQKFLTAKDDINSPPSAVQAIKYITLASGGLSVNYYTMEDLWVVEVTDEDKKIKRSYTDNEGKLILERVYATNGTTILSQTYYVYDEFDRLRVVIQPKAMEQITSIPSTIHPTIVEGFCFQYNYDERGRLISKKVPGGGWVEFAYDRWDRPVISQDANQKAKSPQEFTYVKYDSWNRPIATGTFKSAGRTLTMALVRTELNNASLGARFETRTLGTLPNRDFTNNLSYPKADASNTLTPLTQTCYDDYKYTDLSGFAFTPYLSYTAGAATTNTLGKATAVKTNVLGTGSWLTTVNYYDAYERVIQTQQTNINGVKNFVTTTYDFQGRVLKTAEDNKLTAATGVILQNTYEYDHAGRLVRIKHKTGSQAEIILADYKYTDLGSRMAEKNLNSTNNGASYLQSIDYTFNEQGRIFSINNADLTNDGTLNNDANDLFGMEFKYHNNVIDASKAVYNGNMSEVIWKDAQAAKKKGYVYTYDGLDRLTAAAYRVYASNWTSSAENNRYSMSNVSYDANGNITAMQQNGATTSTGTFGVMDNLTYYYVGNRLSGVVDAVGNTAGYAYDFQNGTNNPTLPDYTYDANGNLNADDNRGISAITYNVLNLPLQVTFSNGNKMVYTYDAMGTKLKKQIYTGATLSTTIDYLGSVQYLNGGVEFASTAEGRVFKGSSSYRYDYFIKDHTGNVRLAFNTNTGTGAAQVAQADDYYPFGNTFNSSVTAMVNRNLYLFGGMELQENGLNAYDFNARLYDPQLGRTFQTDPHADSYASQSPFSFLGNNPIKYMDPTGMDQDEGGGGGGGNDNWMDADLFQQATGFNPYGWNSKGGGYSSVSLKWMGLVYQNGTYYYNSKQINGAKLFALQSLGKTVYNSPHNSSKKIYTLSKFLFVGVINGELRADLGYESTLTQEPYMQAQDGGNRNYGGDGSGSWWDKTLYVADQINQFNPIANLWDAVAYSYNGTDRLGNEMSLTQANLKALGAVPIPIGKIGSISASAVTGLTEHGLNQAITRGFTSPNILQIMRQGTATNAIGRYGTQTRFVLGGNTVVVNAQGKIITVFSTAENGMFIPIK